MLGTFLISPKLSKSESVNKTKTLVYKNLVVRYEVVEAT